MSQHYAIDPGQRAIVERGKDILHIKLLNPSMTTDKGLHHYLLRCQRLWFSVIESDCSQEESSAMSGPRGPAAVREGDPSNAAHFFVILNCMFIRVLF